MSVLREGHFFIHCSWSETIQVQDSNKGDWSSFSWILNTVYFPSRSLSHLKLAGGVKFMSSWSPFTEAPVTPVSEKLKHNILVHFKPALRQTLVQPKHRIRVVLRVQSSAARRARAFTSDEINNNCTNMLHSTGEFIRSRFSLQPASQGWGTLLGTIMYAFWTESTDGLTKE